ncbi:MAG: exodeoxyribonuclease V subunit alpha [Nocardioides sp.]|nr:exodeoxyribonuclease V subunit alpha [Nocardioides sp.]
MTELFEPTGPHDRRLALRAEGLLAAFNEAGVLTAADVHVARRLGALGGETDERVLFAVALTTRAVRHGSVCLDLAHAASLAPGAGLAWPEPADWVAALEASPLLAAEVIRWEFGLLYLDRYRGQEVQVVADLALRAAQPPPALDRSVLDATLDRLFPGDAYVEQREAARLVVSRWTSVLTGGPGTGKTTTIAGLLAMLAEQAEAEGRELRIALTAPTGKAAARLQESVHKEMADAERFTDADRARLERLSASTLHRLLGTRRDNGTRFVHHRTNRLPHDVVIVDETSMVSLTMMARLVEAVRADARLVLVGDRDQLASVDAGAVLADLVEGLGGDDGMVARLETNHRSQQDIIALAAAIRSGDAERALEVLGSGSVEVQFATTPEDLRSEMIHTALAVRAAAVAGDAAAALALLEGHRLLCAHRRGPHGVGHWNRQVEAWLTEETGDPLWDEWYPGRPVLVTANDYGLGIHNGDTGVTVVRDGELRVFIQGATEVLEFAPGRLNDVETMHAMTIHKSQGSQAKSISVLLPDEGARLLTRELLYTAVTRAETKVRVIGTPEVVREAIERRAVRATGLRHRLA